MPRFPRIIPLLCAFAGVAAFATACHAGERFRAADTWTRSYPLAAGGRLAIENENGAIDAEPASGAAAEIVAERSVRARSQAEADALLARVTLRETTAADGVRVVVDAPDARGADVQVRFHVRVPRGVAVELRTVNGAVSVRGLDAPVRAATANGAVRASELATGAVTARSVNGAVEVALAAPLAEGGDVSLATVNGRVALRLPAASRATLRAETTNGSVRAEGAAFDVQRRSPTAVEAKLGGGGARVHLETVNGAARLEASS